MDTWAWSDHSPAPQIRDIRPSWYYNFRVQDGYVEIPIKMAKSEPELAWVLSGYQEGLSGDHYADKVTHLDGRVTRQSGTGKAIPVVYLVPAGEWDEWDATTCIGARWDRADEAAILAKAESLGWNLSRGK
jgi:hypothetical protein